MKSSAFGDMNDNHVGIDINGLKSENASSAGYYEDDGTFKDITLVNRKQIQAWIEYDSSRKQLDVTLHPINVPKPKIPLLSLTKDLSPYLLESISLLLEFIKGGNNNNNQASFTYVHVTKTSRDLMMRRSTRQKGRARRT
ncbi:predicted protein [Arabidopsis lyrata subsp. lyrata]|uniref:Predicted protein n=1 Tax=Arabidopsis lyrata subsp. lyrata TaxID=81972 RepID=D7MJB6_ARALL|nr:predicted protein [Arabidopsis lyrata subsp. lyrata]